MASLDEISLSSHNQIERTKECFVCKIELNIDAGEVPYCCQNCSKSSEIPGPKIWNCIACIGSCARQRHIILDVNGYEVSVCGNHGTINEYFCENDECLCVVCSRCCLREHKNHAFVPLSERSTKIRTQVFEYMSEFDLLSKDLKHHQQLVLDCREFMKEAAEFCSPDKFGKVLLGYAGDLVTKILECGDAEGKRKELMTSFKAANEMIINGGDVGGIEQLANSSEALSVSLRQVLSKSDSVMIENFNKMISRLNGSLEQQKLALSFHLYARPLYIRDENVKTQLTKAVHAFLASLVWPALGTLNYHQLTATQHNYTGLQEDFLLKHTIACPTYNNIFIGTDNNGKWVVFIRNRGRFNNYCRTCILCGDGNLWRHYFFCNGCLRNPSGQSYRTKLNAMQTFPASVINDDILSVRTIYGHVHYFKESGGCFILETKNGFHIANPLQNPKSNEIPLKQVFPELVSRDVVAFYYTASNELNCLVYDDKSRVIKPFLPDDKLKTFNCSSKPRLFCLNYKVTLFAMISGQSNDILVVSSEGPETIPSVEHGFRSIDALQFILDKKLGAHVLVFWNFDRQIFGVARQNRCDSKWILAAVFMVKFPAVDLAVNQIAYVYQDLKGESSIGWDSLYVTLKGVVNPFTVEFQSIANLVPKL